VTAVTSLQPKWGFVCGRISVLEGRLVSRDFLLGLIAQEHMDDFVPHLQDTFLRDYLAPGAPWADFNALTDRCFYELVMAVRGDCPRTEPADLFLVQDDYLNLKNALLGATAFPFLPGLLSAEQLGAVVNGDTSDLPPLFKEPAMRVLEETSGADATTVDVVLDGAYLRHLIAVAEEMSIPLITECVMARVLARAIVAIWRAVQLERPPKLYEQSFYPIGAFTPMLAELLASGDPTTWPAIVGGALGDLLSEALDAPEQDQASRFELGAANHVVRLAREGQMQVAGPERVFSFLVGLYAEMQNLKLVVCGRFGHIDKPLLRERLRESYG